MEESELELLRAGVRILALRALGDADTADDVAQEAIVRALHSLRSSRPPPENIGSFVAGIARHIIADIIRNAPREVSLDRIASKRQPHVAQDPLTALCNADEKEQVKAALEQLSDEDRSLLRLVFYEGLTPLEIAKRLGAPAERIRQRKSRALARLRLAFDELETGSRHDERPGATLEKEITPTLDLRRGE